MRNAHKDRRCISGPAYVWRSQRFCLNLGVWIISTTRTECQFWLALLLSSKTETLREDRLQSLVGEGILNESRTAPLAPSDLENYL
jgi:hypothetical protein